MPIRKKVIKDFFPALLLWLLINYLLFFFKPSGGGGHIPYLDKIAHFSLFASLSFTVFYGIYRTWYLKVSYKIIIVTFLSVLLYAGLTELIQHNFIKDRTGDWYDFFFDIFGTIIGFIAWQGIKSFLVKFKKTKHHPSRS